MKDTIISFFANVPKVIKLGALAFILSLAVDNLIPYSPEIGARVLKAAIFTILLVISNFMFLEDEYKK